MSGKGKPRADARRVKKLSRRAKESQEEDNARPAKQRKIAAKTHAVSDGDDQPHQDDVERVFLLDPLADEPFDNDVNEDVAFVDEAQAQKGKEFSRSVGPSLIPLSVDGVSDHVSLKIKRKIWANEYINLASLLERDMHRESSLLYINTNGQIESRAAESKDTIWSIEHWTDCFLVFMDIYVQRYASKVLELIKYMTVIRDAATHLPGWRQYDRQFRARQALSVSSWAVVHNELWTRVMPGKKKVMNDVSNNNGQSVSSYSNQSASYLKCRFFNNGACHYSRCRFAHVCESCGSREHGKFLCGKQRSIESPMNGTNFARSSFRGSRGGSFGGSRRFRGGNRGRW